MWLCSRSVRNRAIAFSSATFIFLLSVLVYLEIRFLGFPDGFLTELDQAKRRLGITFIWASIPAALWLSWLGWRATRQDISQRLHKTVLLYAVFVILLFAIFWHLRQHLDSGGGG